MIDEELPPPESCANNLYGAEDVSGKPGPSDLCRNAVGVFHMLDCPLFLGRPCSYYEPGAAEREAETDVALEKAARELRQDFLGWGYTLRVRALSLPRDQAPVRRLVEPIDEPEDQGAVRTREGLDEGAEVDDDFAEVDEPEEAEDEPREERVELYPGQRRSEERGKRTPPARAEGADEESPDGAEDEPEEERPKTVDDLLESLPEAPLPDNPPEKPRRGRRGGRGRGRQRGGRSRGASGEAPKTVPGGSEGVAGGEPGKGRRRRGRGRRRPKGGEGAGRAGAKGGDDSAAPADGSGTGRRRRRRRRKPPRRDGSGGDSGGGSGE